MNSLDFTRAALNDIKAICLYIQKSAPEEAEKFYERLLLKCEVIARWPDAGRDRSDLQIGLYCSVFERFMIYYRSDKKRVVIVRVLRAAQDETQKRFPKR